MELTMMTMVLMLLLGVMILQGIDELAIQGTDAFLLQVYRFFVYRLVYLTISPLLASPRLASPRLSSPLFPLPSPPSSHSSQDHVLFGESFLFPMGKEHETNRERTTKKLEEGEVR
eukprot:411896-Hanusia_phi.AAC.2